MNKLTIKVCPVCGSAHIERAMTCIDHYASSEAFYLCRCQDCDFLFTQDFPVEAEIGKYVTVARKEKGGDSWFIGSATGDDARTATVALDFLDPGCQYLATIYRDGPAADHATNPTQIIIEQKKVDNGTVLSIPQARSGGAAIKIAKIK